MNNISAHGNGVSSIPKTLHKYYSGFGIQELIRPRNKDSLTAFIFQIIWERGNEESFFPREVFFVLEQLKEGFDSLGYDESILITECEQINHWNDNELKKELAIIKAIYARHNPHFYLAVIIILYTRNVLFSQ